MIKIGDLYFEVYNSTIADAWTIEDKIIWIDWTPYVYVMQYTDL